MPGTTARLALNYKKIPYTTEWIEYPDLKPKFQSLGIPANDPQVNPNAEYSIPTARFPDGKYIMDSLAIVHELERMQPQPSLRLDTDHHKRAQDAALKLQKGLGPLVLPRVPVEILNPPSREFFEATREKRFGMPLAALEKSDQAGETAWENARPGLDEVRALLHEDESGPYVMGTEPSFADFVLAGMWRFYERLDRGGDLFPRLMKYDGAFQAHCDACRPWLERDD